MSSKITRIAVAAAALVLTMSARAQEALTPIKISYQGASSISLPQNNVAEVLVVRMPTHVVPRGYAIHQLVTRPAGGS